MIKHHPGACPAHYGTHLLTHRRLVAMDRTPLASTLVVTELAALSKEMASESEVHSKFLLSLYILNCEDTLFIANK